MNINDEVWVKLTEDGEVQWAHHWNFFRDNGGVVPAPVRQAQARKNGWTRFAIHELMHIFGPKCYNGSPEQMFEKNVIRLEEPQ